MTTDKQPRPRARGRQAEKAERPTDPPPPGSIADLYRDLLPAVDFVAVQTKIDVALTVRPDQLRNVLATSLQNPKLRMNFLRNLTAVDWEAEGMEVVYHLYSYEHRHSVAIKTRVPSQNAQLPTASDLWHAADWAERECREMFGIEFAGHPDPRNLLLDEDLDIHPLRKSHPLAPIDIPQGIDVAFFQKAHPSARPAATAGVKGADRVAASDDKAAAAPAKKPAADLTPEEAAARKAEQTERVRAARALAAARRAEGPPGSSPRPKSDAPAAESAAGTTAAAATPAAPETAAPASAPASAPEEDAPTSAAPTAPPAPKAAPAAPVSAPDTGADRGDDAAERKASQDERVQRARALATERRAQKREEEGGA